MLKWSAATFFAYNTNNHFCRDSLGWNLKTKLQKVTKYSMNDVNYQQYEKFVIDYQTVYFQKILIIKVLVIKGLMDQFEVTL
jgi:hypothetical protein